MRTAYFLAAGFPFFPSITVDRSDSVVVISVIASFNHSPRRDIARYAMPVLLDVFKNRVSWYASGRYYLMMYEYLHQRIYLHAKKDIKKIKVKSK